MLTLVQTIRKTATILAIAAGLVASAFSQGGVNDSVVSEAKVNGPKLTSLMGLKQRLGEPVPQDLLFNDESGKQIKLGSLLGERPVLLMPVFYNCQTGCALIIDSVMKVLAKGTRYGKLVVGKDLDVVMYSIHPKEGPDLAKSKQTLILRALDIPEGGKHWRLLTSDLSTAQKLSEAIGFKYYYDPRLNIVNHPVCTVILTRDGRVSNYTIGQNFPTKVVETALETANRNEIGQVAEQTSMFGCVRTDPFTGARTLIIERIVRIFMGLTLIFVIGWIAHLTVKYRRTGMDLPTSGQPLTH